MTVVVAYREKEKLYIGADSFAGDNVYHDKVKEPKIFSRDGLTIGFCGSFRAFQTLKYHLKIPKLPKKGDELKWVVTKLIPLIRDVFATHGAMGVQDNVEQIGIKDFSSNFILMLNQKIFIIQEDYSVFESQENFCAIGAGQHFATGAMTILKDLDLKPEEKVKQALEVSGKWSNAVCGPFIIMKV